jgi:hypothetical protein|tara:strand:- start:2780 stop:2983 length:204 start_codon:yes stop_codon:yes gene_type:complete
METPIAFPMLFCRLQRPNRFLERGVRRKTREKAARVPTPPQTQCSDVVNVPFLPTRADELTRKNTFS